VPGNVVLVGFSGTGKSHVGRELARRLGRPFLDTDERLVERFGMPIAEVFRQRGEASFRAAESEEVAAACGGRDAVVALGGGAIVSDDSFRAAREGNLVVRLSASLDTIHARLTSAPGAEARPMLAGEDPRGRMAALLANRERRYAEADATVATDGRSVEQVVDEVARIVGAPWPR
jgi:shikimate kinase